MGGSNIYECSMSFVKVHLPKIFLSRSHSWLETDFYVSFQWFSFLLQSFEKFDFYETLAKITHPEPQPPFTQSVHFLEMNRLARISRLARPAATSVNVVTRDASTGNFCVFS